MSYFDPIDLDIFNLGDLATFQSRDVTDAISSFEVSLSINQSSQVTVNVLDPEFALGKANYFQIRRDIFYRHMWFEISAVAIERSEAVHPMYTLECRSKAVQLMKRDKKPEAYRGMTGYDFASAMAKRFSLNFVGEKTTKKQSIVKGKSRNADDSVWTVLQGLAQEQKFVCFESENTLFFCSEQFLLGKWGDPKCTYGDFKFIPFFYPEAGDEWAFFKEFNEKYILLEMPSVRRSDDDIKAAEGTLVVDRVNGIHLRPGMTIFLGGIPEFEAFYIITDVQFEEGTPDPVQVSFRVPVDPNKEKISSSTASGSSSSTGSNGSNAISDPGQGGQRGAGGYNIIGVEYAKAYAGKALDYLRYRGTNRTRIKNAIGEAVSNIIKYKQTKNFTTEMASLGKYVGLTPNEREIAQNIFSFYMAGKKVELFGVGGGLSSGAIAEAQTAAGRQIDKMTVVSPNVMSSTGGVTRTSPDRVDVPLGGIRPNLSESTKSLIRSYIDSKAPRGSTTTEKTAAKNKAITWANQIYTAPTNTAKKAKYQEFKKKSGSGFGPFTLNKAVYNALRQKSVLNVLYDISTKISTSELNSQIPMPWPTN